MDQDYFDELFAEQAEANEVVNHENDKEADEMAPLVNEDEIESLERSRRARKIVSEIFNEPEDDEDEEQEQTDEEEESYAAEFDQKARPQNRPKLISPGTQSDDKILEARRDFEEALAKMKPTRRRKEGDSEEIVSYLIIDLGFLTCFRLGFG
jgi:hypothetical protein